MDIDQVKTFLQVAAHGSFLEAANRVHVTQSTVSARIQNLEQALGARLFIRNRAGAVLTLAGRRFLRHAKTLVLTYEQARHDVGLASRFRASLTIGARIALWDQFLPRWAARMRRLAPDVSLNTEIGFEEDLMRRVIAGTMDLALMYGPRQGAGLRVDYLFDETLILVTPAPPPAGHLGPAGNHEPDLDRVQALALNQGEEQEQNPDPDQEPGLNRPGVQEPEKDLDHAPVPGVDDDYVYVDWGPTFYAEHHKVYPDFERPARTANIGWLGLQLILADGGTCFVPERVAEVYLRGGCLRRVAGSPTLRMPAYVVYPQETDNEVLATALEVLRELVGEERDLTAVQGGAGAAR
jgi:DNA-binding transcriptional LysR family regulator